MFMISRRSRKRSAHEINPSLTCQRAEILSRDTIMFKHAASLANRTACRGLAGLYKSHIALDGRLQLCFLELPERIVTAQQASSLQCEEMLLFDKSSYCLQPMKCSTSLELFRTGDGKDPSSRSHTPFNLPILGSGILRDMHLYANGI
jgi:hypothetical protein